MELRIGVIGTGQIGEEHIRRLTHELSGSRVVAVASRSRTPAERAAYMCGARVEPDWQTLLHAPDIDAVVIASPSECHEEQVLQAIACRKYVFCEKPLATTASGCRSIVEAELAVGKRFVQVGFMRRYDKGYRQLKSALDSETLGKPLMLHCAHRNVAPHGAFTTEMSVTQTAIHEIDVIRWLLNDDYVSAQIIFPAHSGNAAQTLRDPQILLLRTSKGVCIDLEIYVNCSYGYDIQCEAVCENGVLRLPEPSNLLVRSNAQRAVALETDWVLRFIDSYNIELQYWLDNIHLGKVQGPSAWDGYASAVTADALIRAQHSGQTESISIEKAPDLY